MNSRLFAFSVLTTQAFVCLPAIAQNTLTVPMEIVRISNPDLSAESRGSVTLYRFHPQYTLQMVQGSSRTELSLGGMIERSGNTDLSASRTLPSVRVLWESSSPVALFGLRASLEEASTRETEFAEFGRVTRDSTQRTGTLGGSWTRNLTAGSSVELAASHARLSYDTPLLVDYSETLGSVAYRFESSANSRYSLSASASRLNPDGVGDSASRGELGLGYEVDLSEGVNLNATAGAVRTNAQRSKTVPVGALRLTFTGERFDYAVAWSRYVSAGGSSGAYTRAESFESSLTYPFTVNTSLSLGIARARSLEANGDTGVSAYARIRSELTRFWAFTLGFEQRRAKPFGGPTARGNSVAVGLVYAHPNF
ncbi:hypothetical protein ACVC7V_10555 [Hydrogenophaga sp. A37]|uniref:hypothetical protein n=1 Tax=Hydrogenophaga sp. A37 TaxID=1945864 RepID=UPI000985BD06|nr:hypothetical protein [Hydrogenophaga sp. A37]OOG86942.1 hypothetical protein B0E41_04895 [Hydrogenophaga sp. A37]